MKCSMRCVVTLRIGLVNVGTKRSRDEEVVEVAVRRYLDFCCLQLAGTMKVQERWVDTSSFGWAVRKVFMELGCW